MLEPHLLGRVVRDVPLILTHFFLYRFAKPEEAPGVEASPGLLNGLSCPNLGNELLPEPVALPVGLDERSCARQYHVHLVNQDVLEALALHHSPEAWDVMRHHLVWLLQEGLPGCRRLMLRMWM